MASPGSLPDTRVGLPLGTGSDRPRTGIVYLVGAGPGDPDLITVQGLRCLRRADAIVYDRLVHLALIDEAPSAALRFDCGKAPGHVRRTQEETQRLLIRLAREGFTVVRLKGGDPFVFGRGAEEALALTEAGVPWRLVPGVTSAVAAPASAGIPLTHRGVASSFAVFTGHRLAGTADHDARPVNDLSADTVVALMAVRRLREFVERLLAAGRRPDTPAALIERATMPGSRTVVAPLAELPARAAEVGIHSPATLVVGRVVALRSDLCAGLGPVVLTSHDPLQATPLCPATQPRLPTGDPDMTKTAVLEKHPEVPRPSKIEEAKRSSRRLRGTVAATLDSEAPAFGHQDIQVLKFHGVYQQDNRDTRKVRRLTGDGKEHWFMVRAKIPGGELTADQYLALDRITGRHADASLRLTTRQGVQLHGVVKDELKAAVARMNRALLSTLAACGDVERNVMAPPAPFLHGAFADARRLAAEISADLCPRGGAYHQIWLDGEKVETGDPEPLGHEPFYGDAYLPRKLKTAIALAGDRGDDTVDIHTQDVGLIAIPRADVIQHVQVLVGGGLGMTHRKADTFARLATPLGSISRDRTVHVVRAIAAVFRDHGNRSDRRHARLKYLIEDWGLERFRREVEARLGWQLDPSVEFGPLRHPDRLGRHAQGDGRFFFGVFIAEGRIVDTPVRQIRTALRRAVEALRPRVLLTPDQNLLLADLAEKAVEAVEQILSAHGVPLPGELSRVRRHGVACPALPTCGLALTESERVMADVVADLEAELDRHGLQEAELAVRMTGCPNGCARPYTADLGIVGSGSNAYDLYVGGGLARGRLADLWAVKVPREEIAASLSPLFSRWAEERVLGESLGDFHLRTFRGGLPRTLLTGDKSLPT